MIGISLFLLAGLALIALTYATNVDVTVTPEPEPETTPEPAPVIVTVPLETESLNASIESLRRELAEANEQKWETINSQLLQISQALSLIVEHLGTVEATVSETLSTVEAETLPEAEVTTETSETTVLPVESADAPESPKRKAKSWIW